MCDPTPLKNWLIAILTFIGLAVGAIVAASITNGSFFLAWMSPGWMWAAAGLTGAAVFACNQALSALDVYCRCVGERCAGQCYNLRNLLRGTAVVLGAQAAACLGVAGYAWIPWAAQPSMWMIIGALLAQLALIVSGIVFYVRLLECGQSQAGSPEPRTPTGPGTRPVG
jgi:hypothetical protein